MLVGGSLIATMIDKFWWLVYVGSAVIIWTGAELIFKDPFIQQFHVDHTVELVISALVTVVLMGAAHYFHRHRPKMRRLRQQQAPID